MEYGTEYSALLPRTWISGALNVNAAAGTALATTPALRAGAYSVTVVCWTTVAVDIILEERNSTNTSNVNTQRIAVTARSIIPHTFEFTITDLEIIRLELVQTIISGNSIQASIFYKRVS